MLMKRLQTTHPALSLCKTQIRVLFRNAMLPTAALFSVVFDFISNRGETANHWYVGCWWGKTMCTLSGAAGVSWHSPFRRMGKSLWWCPREHLEGRWPPEKLWSFPVVKATGVCLPMELQWWWRWSRLWDDDTCKEVHHQQFMESLWQEERWIQQIAFSCLVSCQRDSVKLVKETGWTWNLDPKHQKVRKELLHFGCFREESTNWSGLIEVGFYHHSHSVGVPPVASKDSADLNDLERVFFSS